MLIGLEGAHGFCVSIFGGEHLSEIRFGADNWDVRFTLNYPPALSTSAEGRLTARLNRAFLCEPSRTDVLEGMQ
jgi:hypothetical protein